MAEPLRADELEDPLVTVPPGGWTIEHLDAWPESHLRHELTDGALTVSPSPSSLHQVVAGALMMALGEQASARRGLLLLLLSGPEQTPSRRLLLSLLLLLLIRIRGPKQTP